MGISGIEVTYEGEYTLEKLSAIVNDNLTGLAIFRIRVQGRVL